MRFKYSDSYELKEPKVTTKQIVNKNLKAIIAIYDEEVFHKYLTYNNYTSAACYRDGEFYSSVNRVYTTFGFDFSIVSKEDYANFKYSIIKDLSYELKKHRLLKGINERNFINANICFVEFNVKENNNSNTNDNHKFICELRSFAYLGKIPINTVKSYKSEIDLTGVDMELIAKELENKDKKPLQNKKALKSKL